MPVVYKITQKIGLFQDDKLIKVVARRKRFNVCFNGQMYVVKMERGFSVWKTEWSPWGPNDHVKCLDYYRDFKPLVKRYVNIFGIK